MYVHPDVIILDISMTVMNGIEAIQELTQCGSTAKVVFLTVETGNNLLMRALRRARRAMSGNR